MKPNNRLNSLASWMGQKYVGSLRFAPILAHFLQHFVLKLCIAVNGDNIGS